jgi:hypothetical protein
MKQTRRLNVIEEEMQNAGFGIGVVFSVDLNE